MNKTTRNRKKVLKEGWINNKGERLEICNSQEYGVYGDIVHNFIDQLDAAYLIHGRILVVRLDFKINIYTDTNAVFSNFMKNTVQWLSRSDYGINKVGYQWVREQEKSKKQHYHLALILDGSKIQSPKKLSQVLKEKWLPKGGMYIPDDCYYYIDKHNYDQQRKAAIYRCSYLAKSRGKGCRPAQTKDYASSRLVAN